MKDGRFRYLLGGIAIPPETFSEDEAVRAAANRMKRAGISPQSLHFRLYKRSVDARRRDRIRLVCTVLAESAAPLPGAVCRRLDLRPLAEAPPPAPPGAQPMGAPPLIVGMGPAGLFAGLLLARAGYKPVLIDRGGEMADRVAILYAGQLIEIYQRHIGLRAVDNLLIQRSHLLLHCRCRRLVNQRAGQRTPLFRRLCLAAPSRIAQKLQHLLAVQRLFPCRQITQHCPILILII